MTPAPGDVIVAHVCGHDVRLAVTRITCHGIVGVELVRPRLRTLEAARDAGAHLVQVDGVWYVKRHSRTVPTTSVVRRVGEVAA